MNQTVIIAGNVLDERGVYHKAASSACKELIEAALRIQIGVLAVEEIRRGRSVNRLA